MDFKLWLEYSGAKSVLVYHGTDPKNIPSIMSQGLIPNPKARKWADDPHANFNSASRKSIGGIYLTTNLQTAFSAAPPRTACIVVAEVQPRSMLADEDDLMSMGQASDHEYTLLELFFAIKTNTNHEFVEQMKAKYEQSVFARITWKIPNISPQLKIRVKQILDDAFPYVVDRQTAHVHTDEFRNRKYYHKEAKDVQQPNKQAAEAAYQKHLDLATRALKSIGNPYSRKENSLFMFVGRLMEPIRFSGANKIVCVIETWLNEKNKTRVKLLYGSVPDKLIKDWNSAIGPWEKAISEEGN
jgi:hypothetical protein